MRGFQPGGGAKIAAIAATAASALAPACRFDPSGVAGLGESADATTAKRPDAATGGADAGRDPDAGGAPDAAAGGLGSDGLVVRYFIDEAADGTGPSGLADSAPDPLALSIDYGSEGALAFATGPDGNRGLAWSEIVGGDVSRASVAIDGTKLHAALDGSTEGTIEVVAGIDAINGALGPIVHIGRRNEEGAFSLLADGSAGQRLELRLGNNLAGRWSVDLASSDRMVITLVLSSDDSREEDRAILYVNGSRVPGQEAPDQGTAITLGTKRFFVLGNRENGDRTNQGQLYYASIYGRALSPSEVADHAAFLAATDDRTSP